MLSWLFDPEKKENSIEFWKDEAGRYKQCWKSACNNFDRLQLDAKRVIEENKIHKEQIAILLSELIRAKACEAGFNAYEEMARVKENAEKLVTRKKPGNKPGQKWSAARREAYWAKKVKVG